jgi:hypothetical protein
MVDNYLENILIHKGNRAATTRTIVSALVFHNSRSICFRARSVDRSLNVNAMITIVFSGGTERSLPSYGKSTLSPMHSVKRAQSSARTSPQKSSRCTLVEPNESPRRRGLSATGIEVTNEHEPLVKLFEIADNALLFSSNK